MTKREATAWVESTPRGLRPLIAEWAAGFKKREALLFMAAFVAPFRLSSLLLFKGEKPRVK